MEHFGSLIDSILFNKSSYLMIDNNDSFNENQTLFNTSSQLNSYNVNFNDSYNDNQTLFNISSQLNIYNESFNDSINDNQTLDGAHTYFTNSSSFTDFGHLNSLNQLANSSDFGNNNYLDNLDDDRKNRFSSDILTPILNESIQFVLKTIGNDSMDNSG